MGPVTFALLLANVVAFGIEQRLEGTVVANFALWPIGRYLVPDMPQPVGFHYWQLLTSSFLHANTMHIFLNMFALWMFGRDVERTLGSRRYLVLYFAAVLTAGLVQLLVVSSTLGPEVFPTLGASGGVFGVLLAFAYLYPRRIVVLLFPPIPMPAWLFVGLYGLIELGSGVFGTQAGIAHFAHLGGMLGAFIVLYYWRGQAR
jgi:rhomboid family protein